MRKRRTIPLTFGLLLLVAVAAPVQAVRSPGSHPSISARAAILVDNQTGEVLWARNPDLPLPNASTTKVVTAMLALQSGRLDDALSVTPEAAQAPPSRIRLRPGWKMRLRDLVYAVLLNSANDASIVIAEGLSGSVRDFAERMNAEARALGATNTHFVNPNGLPAPNHYSTARDLATMCDPLFQTIVSTKTAAIFPAAGSFRRIALHNHNRLLGNYRIQVVGKTGWTLSAKKCFVGAGRADGRELGVAILGSRDLWGDVKRLLEFGFNGGALPEADGAEIQSASAVETTSIWDGLDTDLHEPLPAQKFFVQLGAFRSLKSATRLKSAVIRRGYAARTQTVRHGYRRQYTVLVGAFATRRQAAQAALRLNGKKHRAANIVIARS